MFENVRFYAEMPILGLNIGGKLEKVERLVAALGSRCLHQMQAQWKKDEGHSHICERINKESDDAATRGGRCLDLVVVLRMTECVERCKLDFLCK